MRVVALVESFDHVCARYRMRAYIKPLAERGIALDLVEIPKHIPLRQKLFWNLKNCRVILLRKLLSWLDWRILRSRAKWVGFDFDDAVYLRDSYSGKGFDDPRRTSRFNRIINESDAIVGGNNHLIQKALECGTKGKTQVIPTCVDIKAYPPKRNYKTDNNLTLVWIGSSSTLQGLDRFRSALEEMGKSVPKLKLKLICDKFLSFINLETTHCAWSEATEAIELAKADIGISWIPDDPWSQGKCGLKLIQYMAAGLPVIANPVGVHSEMISQGKNGFLVNSTDDWIEAANNLKNDQSMREELGINGRRYVEQLYSVEYGTKAWLDILK